MPRRIPFTKAMHEAVREAAEAASGPGAPLDNRLAKPLLELAGRMEAASLPLEASGMSTRDLTDLLTAAGCTVAYPPRPSRNWWDKIHRVIRDAGLDMDSGLRVARAASRLRQPVTLEQVVYRISALLAQENSRNAPQTVQTRTGWAGRREFDGDVGEE